MDPPPPPPPSSDPQQRVSSTAVKEPKSSPSVAVDTTPAPQPPATTTTITISAAPVSSAVSVTLSTSLAASTSAAAGGARAVHSATSGIDGEGSGDRALGMHRKHLSRPRLSKLFVKEGLLEEKRSSLLSKETLLKSSSATLASVGEGEDLSALPADRRKSYERVAQLNRSLKMLKVHRFKLEKLHVVSCDPSCSAEDDTLTIHHPFERMQKKYHEVHPMTMKPDMYHRPSSKMKEDPSPVPVADKAFTPRRSRIPSTIDESEQENYRSSSVRFSSLFERRNVPQKEGRKTTDGRGRQIRSRKISPGHKQVSHPQPEEHVWTPEFQGEYELYNQIVSCKRQRRRSVICRHKWRKAANIINIVHHLSYCIAVSSLAKDSHLKTFADIGDQAATETETEKGLFSQLDIGFKSKKSEAGELFLSTKVQVLMCHTPETRSNDEVTLILCDLQCFPSFCTYPLAVQNKIARCGMYMPVTKRRVIIRQGHEAQNWYFVIAGQAIETEIETKEDGSEIQNTVKFITQGMTFGEEAILSGEPHTFTVTSRKNMQLLRLKKKHFLEVVSAMPELLDDVPDHIQFIKKKDFMASFPVEILLKHPTMCFQYYSRPNAVLVADSTQSEWIFVIRSGSCMVYMYTETTKASWKDLELALAHPLVNAYGMPLPKIDSGPGRLPLRKTAYTLFQRMSAQDIFASNLNQVPVLQMTRGGSKNVRHGLHLLTGESVNRMKCPWPLDFFDAMNRTAFTITRAPSCFPIEPGRGAIVVPKVKPPRPSSHSRPEDFHNFQYRDDQALMRKLTVSQAPSKLYHTTPQITGPNLNVNASETPSSNLFSENGTISNKNTNALFKQNCQDQETRNHIRKIKMANKATAGVFLTEMDERTKEDQRGRQSAQPGLNKTSNAKRRSRVHGKHTSANTDSSRHSGRSGQTDRKKSGGPAKSVDEEASCEQLSVPSRGTQNDRKQKASRKTEPSATERRKRYVVPDRCKPPPPSESWKKKSAPYECVSPPVYILIGVLTEGDCFGLDQLQEPGWESRDQSGVVALVSRGAEVVMLNKRFFMSFANEKTHVAIRDCMHIYPTQQAVQTRYRLQLAWELYSNKVQDELAEDLRRQGKTHHGTYFTETRIEIRDPYPIINKDH